MDIGFSRNGSFKASMPVAHLVAVSSVSSVYVNKSFLLDALKQSLIIPTL